MLERQKPINEIDPPPIATSDAEAVEVMRVWVSPDTVQQVTLHITWEDPAAGLLLVDVARHAAKAYAREGYDEAETLRTIRELFDAEWDNPTDEARDISEDE